MSSITPSATRKSASLARLQVENGRPYSAGLDLAIFLTSRRSGSVNVRGRPPLYLGQRESKPSTLKSLDHAPNPVRAGERHLRDPARSHALRGQQDHLSSPLGHHRPGAPPHDPQQPLPLVIIDLASLSFEKSTKVDALLISCGGLRTLNVQKPLEDKHGLPVVSSTPAALWDAVRLGGHSGHVAGYGQLFENS